MAQTNATPQPFAQPQSVIELVVREPGSNTDHRRLAGAEAASVLADATISGPTVITDELAATIDGSMEIRWKDDRGIRESRYLLLSSGTILRDAHQPELHFSANGFFMEWLGLPGPQRTRRLELGG